MGLNGTAFEEQGCMALSKVRNSLRAFSHVVTNFMLPYKATKIFFSYKLGGS